VGPLRGYQQKPRAIAVIAIIFLMIPVVMVIQMVVVSGGSWRVVGAVLGSTYVVQEWLLSWSAAAAVYIVSRWSLAYFVVLSGYALSTKLVRLLSVPHLETPLSFFITCVWFAVVLYFFASSLATPYLNPKLRWWTRPPRVPLCREAMITVAGATLPITVWNLSPGGAFVKLDSQQAEHLELPRRLGQDVAFATTLALGDPGLVSPVHFAATAHLVWVAAPESPHRDGVGIRFTSLTGAQRRSLKRFLRYEARQTRRPAV
jgi:hypothetical protein